MRIFLWVIVAVLISTPAVGQDKKLDRLEMFYSQAYYGKVLRMTKRMMARPEFDYSALPNFYQSLSLFRLSGDPYWFKHHPDAIDDAITCFAAVVDHSSAQDYLKQHSFELAEIKVYLTELKPKMEELGWNGSAARIGDFLKNELGNIDELSIITQHANATTAGSGTPDPPQELPIRDKLVVYAKQFVGVPYKWAGSDENGFDCSGFTSFVFRKFGIVVSRSSSAQYTGAKQLSMEEAEKGDLVFFGPGATVTHVGMLISEKGSGPEMIHASTSKGVILTEINGSDYWKPKLKGAGTYL
jgi:cell wall-associated NlpC family hydrolase